MKVPFTANLDYVTGTRLSKAYDKFKDAGFLVSPDPLQDDQENDWKDESGNVFIIVLKEPFRFPKRD